MPSTKAILCGIESSHVMTIESDALDVLQGCVGGDITVIPQILLPSELRGLTVYVNEMGLELPLNRSLRHGPPIYGNAVITATRSDGEDVGLTEAQIADILAFLA